MSNGSKPGYLVRAILRRGAAKRHGIEVGDLITSVAGKPVNAKGALGRILSGYKSGANVNVHITKLDGTKLIKRVKLGGKKGARASLGIISGKKAARRYNAKVSSTAKIPSKKKLAGKAPAKPKAFASAKAEPVAYNSLRKKADDEMALSAAYLEDRKAADDLLSAKRLRRKLESDNKRRLAEHSEDVSAYLDALAREKNAELEANYGPKSGKKLSLFAKAIIALGTTGVLSALGALAYTNLVV